MPVLIACMLLAGTAAIPSMAAKREVDLRTLGDRKVKVERIRFVHLNHKPFGNPYLRTAMVTREGKIFRRRHLRDDLMALENLYRGIGYLDAEIVGKQYLIDIDNRLHIRLKIESGERWQVEEVGLSFHSAEEGDQGLDDLYQHLQSAAGRPFEYKTVLDDERTLLTILNNRGYAHGRIRNKTELDPEKKCARIIYEITSGRRMYFGPIEIRERVGDRLHTRPNLIRSYLKFRKGQLYDPEKLRITRNNLSRTNLFRSVTLTSPEVSSGDSLQPIEVWLQERKFIHFEANTLLNNTEPGVSTKLLHSNWLGRGTRLGFDGSLGRPIQGTTLYLTERNVLDSGADLTVSAGLTDEWGRRQVFADPSDSVQFALLSANDSILADFLLFAGEIDAAEYIASSIYSYRSIERLWQFKSVLSRRWEPVARARYHAHIDLNWVQSRNQPISRGTISYNSPSGDETLGRSQTGEISDEDSFPDGDSLTDEDPFGDDTVFGGEDPFGDDDPFENDFSEDFSSGDGSDERNGCDPDDADYACGRIRIDDTWRRMLTDKAKTLNLSIAFHQDSRDNQIAPSRGTLLRAAGRYAVQFGGQSTRVLDGDVEWRQYVRFGPNIVWASAARGLLITSLHKDRAIPQSYWIEFGGEGSVRGVDRNRIQEIGGGRAGLNLRSELRIRIGGSGIVGFWDRAGVWRNAEKAKWSAMTNGYGVGLRYERGIPFRLDVGWSENFKRRRIYFSIGQAF